MKVGPKQLVGQPPPVSGASPAPVKRPEGPPDVFVGGAPLKEIALSGTITDPKVQISGMAWHGDDLVLLPQWPDRLYVLSKAEVTAAIVEGKAPALTPREVKVLPEGFGASFPGYEGFEAISIVGDRVYLLAEAKKGEDMFGYLVAGKLTDKGLELDLSNVKALPPATQINNIGYEAMVVSGDRLIVMPEAAGGPHVAHAFSLDGLNPLGSLPMASMDYRLTDSTPADADGRFWVTNYNHPGDAGLPVGPRNETLVPMQVEGGHLEIIGPPMHIKLDMTQPARNWEALERLDDRGFLVMTDEFPRAIFGFVPK